MPDEPYKVALDVYSGPLELLLYLIKKEEVDVRDIPIARITGQYLEYVELIRRVDINLAGEFLVMAATLMEIKSRMLAPQPAGEEETSTAAQLADPRQQLVAQLLEYKRIKDAADALANQARTERQRFPRAVKHATGPSPLDIEDLNLFTLIDAFNAIMASVGHTAFGHEVVYDDTPISLHQADILDRLQRDGPLTLQHMFSGRTRKSELIGLFLAMLELIREKRIAVEQSEPLGELRLSMRTDAPEGSLSPSNPDAPAPGLETNDGDPQITQIFTDGQEGTIHDADVADNDPG